eukprot:scaffold179262_cov39-Tisochrysis_lutea.AAC.2
MYRLGLGAKPPRGTVASAGEMQLKDKIQKEAQRDQKRKRDGGGRTHAAHEPGQVVGKHPSPHKLLGAQSTEPGFQYGAPKHGAFGVQGTQWVQAGASGGTHGSGIPAGKAESESDEEEGRASRFKKKASLALALYTLNTSGLRGGSIPLALVVHGLSVMLVLGLEAIVPPIRSPGLHHSSDSKQRCTLPSLQLGLEDF